MAQEARLLRDVLVDLVRERFLVGIVVLCSRWRIAVSDDRIARLRSALVAQVSDVKVILEVHVYVGCPAGYGVRKAELEDVPRRRSDVLYVLGDRLVSIFSQEIIDLETGAVDGRRCLLKQRAQRLSGLSHATGDGI